MPTKPPEQNAAFVAAMEDVLDVYQRPYDEHCHVICIVMDNLNTHNLSSLYQAFSPQKARE